MSGLLINIIGAESTGKSVLGSDLSDTFGGILIPEFARTYCSNLNHPPDISDIHIIAEEQLKQYDLYSKNKEIVIFDTTLITSLIWMYDKYGVSSLIYHKNFLNQKFDLTFLCYPDLGWHPDPLRQDANRQLEIHQMYVNYLLQNNKSFHLVKGFGVDRNKYVKKVVQSLI